MSFAQRNPWRVQEVDMTTSDIALGAALVNVGRELHHQAVKIAGTGINSGSGDALIDRVVEANTQGSATQNETHSDKKQSFEMDGLDFIEAHKQSLEESIPSLLSLVQQYETILKAIEVQEEMKRKPIGFTPPQEIEKS